MPTSKFNMKPQLYARPIPLVLSIFVISASLMYLLLCGTYLIRFYPDLDKLLNKKSQSIIDTSINIMINSNLSIVVKTYGTIIDPQTIYEPGRIPAFRNRTSIVNPSLIKLPNFIGHKLGKYYLYFAHHIGTDIYLAISNNSIFGPYKLHKEGAFHISETKYGLNHIASPDVHINVDKRRIEMYYHTHSPEICQGALKYYIHSDIKYGAQCTLKAFSKDGLLFTDEYYHSQNKTSYIYGHFYFRAFQFENKLYAFAKNDNDGGILYGFIEYINEWVILKKYANIPMRHSAILVDNKRGNVFLFTSIDVSQVQNIPESDIVLSSAEIERYSPESIWVAIIEMNTYELKYMTQLLTHKTRTSTVHSPAIYVENEEVYLLYCLNAEQDGIAIAKLDFLYKNKINNTIASIRLESNETKLLIWPRIPKTGGTNFWKLLETDDTSVKINSNGVWAYIEHHGFTNSHYNFTIIPREKWNTEPVNNAHVLERIEYNIHETVEYNINYNYVIHEHFPFVPSISENITAYLRNDYKTAYLYNKWQYICIIRDPISRIISSFNYVRGSSGGVYRANSAGNYVKYYVPWMQKTSYGNIDECVDDYQTGQNVCQLSTNYYVKWFCGTGLHCDPFNISTQSLNTAITNIDTYFAWIGVLEFSHASFQKFNSQFPNFVSSKLRNNYLQITQELKLERKQSGYHSHKYQMPSAKSIRILTKANDLDYRLFYHVLEKYNYQ